MTHDELVARAVHWLKGTKKCIAILAEVRSGTVEIPDAIGWTFRSYSTLVECKVSRSDFYADKWKSFRRFGGLGDYRYYMTPPRVLGPYPKLLEGWGLLECHPKRVLVKVDAVYQKGGNQALADRKPLVKALAIYQTLHGIRLPRLQVEGYDPKEFPK